MTITKSATLKTIGIYLIEFMYTLVERDSSWFNNSNKWKPLNINSKQDKNIITNSTHCAINKLLFLFTIIFIISPLLFQSNIKKLYRQIHIRNKSKKHSTKKISMFKICCERVFIVFF